VSLVTIDASFISLKLLLPVVRNWYPPGASNQDLLALVKPQFEAGRKQVARGDGVIRDPLIHRQVLLDVLAYAVQDGYTLRGLLRSPLLGPKGNVEFLAWLSYALPQGIAESGTPLADIEELVDSAVPPVPQPTAGPDQP
jgi:23S rRNA (cytidine1920-2'-O)/16S rRNA (cytidine1409-2'-O)-methyltransferase